jgi:ER membrane protein complex subunit 3
MILTGILRHHLSVLLQTTPTKPSLAKLGEQRSLARAQNLRANFPQIPKASFERRKEAFLEGVKEGKYLAEGPESRGKGKPNPLSDPAMMEGMMGMMKGNMAMMVPQSLIMGWINAFFSGYVISKSKRSEALLHPSPPFSTLLHPSPPLPTPPHPPH